nr:PfkB family carbohydrate kinase [Ardenticatena sp.]
MSVEYLVIGNITKDLQPDGTWRLGGTAAYSVLAAHRLGYRAALVTRADASVPLEEMLPGVQVHRLPCEVSTTFENIYNGNARTQWLRAWAPPIAFDDIPEAWRTVPIVHLGPIAQECDPHLAAHFPNALVGATPQGWMRTWDETGRVAFRPLVNPAEAVAHIDVLVFSTEDVHGNRDALHALVRAVPVTVITCADEGCFVVAEGKTWHVHARPVAHVVDPTGAGDVFATAFILRYAEQHDVLDAACFANVAASFAVEGVGVEAVPDRARIHAWLAHHKLPIERVGEPL